MAGAEGHEQTREAETAILQLLEATNAAKRKRAADGLWRPQTAPNSGSGDGPGQAILRLSGLYSGPNPPPVLLIRHPQVASSPHTVTHLASCMDGIIRNSLFTLLCLADPEERSLCASKLLVYCREETKQAKDLVV